MSTFPSTAPILSTPATHIFNDTSSGGHAFTKENISDEQIEIKYEIERTISEIRRQKWHRVALQFPDDMLPDSVRVYQLLARGLEIGQDVLARSSLAERDAKEKLDDPLIESTTNLNLDDQPLVKFTILGDTSYGSCCIDEIAAEHVNADAVVHYGRACLSPTARLPALHIFTRQPLDYSAVGSAFADIFKDRTAHIILTADVTYANHITPMQLFLETLGYTNIFASSITHDPSSAIPNRTVPDAVKADPEILKTYQLFHISDPPTSLLLTLTSRVADIYIYPTAITEATPSSSIIKSTSTSTLLRRRYGLVTSLSTVSTWGILINTLSVKNYLDIVEYVKKQIADAGRKSYLFVVGKLNAAKVANFSEIGGWVVIGCWESSLIDSKDFYKPVVTPFELGLALQRDDERLWTGQWISDFQAVLDSCVSQERGLKINPSDQEGSANDVKASYDSEEESAPPEFDLRTGRYVSRGSHVPAARSSQIRENQVKSDALMKRTNGEMATVNGIASPAAEYLRSKRTWQGLGSDFEVRYDQDEEPGSLVEEGRTGIAGGYSIGGSNKT